MRITPTAKNLARREGINLLNVEPKEDGSQITVADIETLIAERPKPMARMRQIIAQRLTQSYTQAPHFFVTVSADVTELEALRAELKAQGASYTHYRLHCESRGAGTGGISHGQQHFRRREYPCGAARFTWALPWRWSKGWWCR